MPQPGVCTIICAEVGFVDHDSGTVAFLIPTEIFPSDLRAQGNGFGITGWAIGVGWTVLVNPIMFGHLKVGYVNSVVASTESVADILTNLESNLLSLRRPQSFVDPNRVLLLPRDNRQVARIDRSHVYFIISTLQEYGESIQNERGGYCSTKCQRWGSHGRESVRGDQYPRRCYVEGMICIDVV